MNKDALRLLLESVSAGDVGIDEAVARLRTLPYENLGFARVDHHRALRGGAPEAIFCPGKTPAQVVAIAQRLAERHPNILATRAGDDVVAALAAAGVPHRYHPDARLVVVRPEAVEGVGLVVVAAAGTADVPVAEEAALVAEALGNRVERVYDCGVAGLHRLLDHVTLLAEANAVVAVAGMEGALPSVIAGLIDRPVIAVPTSVGYGSSLNGLAALLAMLNSCASGVSVVNIDNGFGAAHQASQINRLVAKIR
ncbi:MAG: nickel pincer cofactor biosynthesis protein LarB [Candidatus Rokubacteria bacterium]|nr:nickel pincer cofactor biosynthesis protein LarB [Candidatus Rokubacteria bacterium]